MNFPIFSIPSALSIFVTYIILSYRSGEMQIHDICDIKHMKDYNMCITDSCNGKEHACQ